MNTKQVNNFIMSIQGNKEAYDLFREEAVKKGLLKEDPLP